MTSVNDAGARLTARVIRSGLSLMPWALSLYVLYRLEQGSGWFMDQPLRPVFSVLVLTLGLASSFAIHSYLAKRR